MSKQDSTANKLTLDFNKDKNKSKWKDAIFLDDNTPESRKARIRFKRPLYHMEYIRRLKGESI